MKEETTGESTRRKGKIAQLDKVIRDRINEMMRNGKTYEAILTELVKVGVEDITVQNLSNWFQGGHKDWLREQERMEDMRLKREYAAAYVRENHGSDLAAANEQLVSAQLYELLTDVDLGGIKELIAEEPENYAKIVNAMARVSTASIDRDRYEFDAAKAVLKHLSTLTEVASNTTLTEAEQLQSVRNIMWGRDVASKDGNN
jgi:hypothetical protein